MGRLGQTLTDCRAAGRAALVPYLCCGDPSPERTVELVLAAADAGADIVELGMPFSDPTADGPVIQRASARALKAGMTLSRLFEVVREVRRSSSVPLLLFGYYNPLLRFGEAAAVHEAKAAGIDGFLVVDLPPEEANDLAAACAAAELDFVPLLAPTSTARREQKVREIARGFVYYVSMTGITGGKVADLRGAAERANALSERIGLPVALGFGIKTPEDAAVVAPHVHGVVVGSALTTVVEQHAADPVPPFRAAIEDLRRALA
ncbi:MAG: tryptophan synthase subunit alpha [Myxococcota bacterium]